MNEESDQLGSLLRKLDELCYSEVLKIPSRTFSFSRLSHLSNSDVFIPQDKLLQYIYSPAEPILLLKYLLGKNQLFEFTSIPAFYQCLDSMFYSKRGVLFRLFFTLSQVPTTKVYGALTAKLTDSLCEVGFLKKNDEGIISEFAITPIRDKYILENRSLRSMGRSAYLMAEKVEEIIKQKKPKYWVDFCTGTGVYPVIFSKNVEHCIAVDIDRNALEIAGMNLAAGNIKNVQLIQADSFNSVNGIFDLITFNPPFGFLPKSYYNSFIGNGGELGIEVSEKMLTECMDHLNIGGEAHMITMSPVIDGKNILFERMQEKCTNHGMSMKTKILADMNFIDLVKYLKIHNVTSMQYMFVSVINNGLSEMEFENLTGIKELCYGFYRRFVKTLSIFYPQAV